MPWRLESRNGQVCVIKESDGSVAGCHPDRVSAIKQQRALYAQESRMASMYDELDSRSDPVPVAGPALAASALSPLASELVGLLLRDEREKSLVASMADSQAEIVRQNQEAREKRHALVAALTRMGSPVINLPEPVVNVNVPAHETTVNVPAPEVTVNVPDVKVEVAAPQVTVRPEIVMPSPAQKTVEHERDPLTREIIRSTVTEG